MKPHSYLVNHSTCSPSFSQLIAQRAEELEIASLDAPVTGGEQKAKEGQLITMVGGKESHFDQMKPLIETFS